MSKAKQVLALFDAAKGRSWDKLGVDDRVDFLCDHYGSDPDDPSSWDWPKGAEKKKLKDLPKEIQKWVKMQLGG